MEHVTPIRLNLAAKFKGREYFSRFWSESVKLDIAGQLRLLRKLRGITQVQAAKLAGMKQSAYSRAENGEYGSWNLKTLLRLVDALDAKMDVKFTPREKVIAKYKKREAREEAYFKKRFPSNPPPPSPEPTE